MEITREKFEAYEEVRAGGQTNMLDTIMVSHLSDNRIGSDEVSEVISNYAKYKETYGKN